MGDENNPSEPEVVEPSYSGVTEADMDAADFAASGIGGLTTTSRRNMRLVAGFVSRDAPLTPEVEQALRETVLADHKNDVAIFRVAMARREIARLARYAEMMDSCEDAIMRLAQADDASISELLRATEYIAKRYEAIRESMEEITKLPPITINVNQDNRTTTNVMGVSGIDLTDKSSRENIRNFFRGATKQLEAIARGDMAIDPEKLEKMSTKQPGEGEA